MKNTKGVLWLALICLLILLSAPFKAFAAQDSAADLSGLWGSERSLGPLVRGELFISQQGAQWRASIAGFDVPLQVDADAWTFSLPGGLGEFRARVKRDATKITGQWIQPASPSSGNRYATPVELNLNKGKVWRGLVEPFDDRVSLYILVQPQADGTLGAFIRNPESNVGAFLRIGRVVAQGEAVRFLDREGKELLSGTYHKDSGLLSINFPAYNATFDFTRRGRDDAVGFYPRTPSLDQYTYRQPLMENDGWTTATLAEVGLDPQPLKALVQRVLSTKTEAVNTPYIQALLVARKGKLALEEYFYGFHKDRTHDMRSASKSLTAALVGLAIEHGAPFNFDTPVYTLFPDYKAFAHEDARKQKLTVEHLLTMTSGYDCDDFNSPNPGNENQMQSQTEQPDWYKYTLDLPMVRNPGERAVYCTAGINLLGGIITNTTRTWLPDFIYENFARPLDIHHYHVNLTPLGNAYMGGGIQMRPRDFMKLGQLFLDGGRWNGHQLLNRSWIERATAPRSSLNRKDDYGYAWHLNEYRVGAKTYRAYSAEGNGGQLLIVLPELELVVMCTGGNYSDFRTWSKLRDELMPQFIIPAAVRQ